MLACGCGTQVKRPVFAQRIRVCRGTGAFLKVSEFSKSLKPKAGVLSEWPYGIWSEAGFASDFVTAAGSFFVGERGPVSIQKRIKATLKTDHAERPTRTLGWSLARARGILEQMAHSSVDFVVSRSGWHRNRGAFIRSQNNTPRVHLCLGPE